MKFLLNTKPVVDGLELAIINSNVTRYYQKSCIVEINIEGDSLRINTEASSIQSELVFKGKATGEGASHCFVDSLLFKQLMKTIETNTVEFEITENGLVIYSGKSKFNLPQVVSGDDIELKRPENYEAMGLIEVDKDSWEFVKDHQLYAIAMSFIHPVYTHIWLGDSGDVLVGDFDNSIFTKSNMVSLGSTCLITSTIINLLTSVPEGSQIKKIGKTYQIIVSTDPYEYICEFEPKYEEDAGIGSYSSKIILDLFESNAQSVSINTKEISKAISQAELFMTRNDEVIELSFEGDVLKLKNDNINCAISIENILPEFSLSFKINLLKDAINHMDEEEINIYPLVRDEEYSGLIFWTNNMSTVLAGVA